MKNLILILLLSLGGLVEAQTNLSLTSTQSSNEVNGTKSVDGDLNTSWTPSSNWGDVTLEFDSTKVIDSIRIHFKHTGPIKPDPVDQQMYIDWEDSNGVASYPYIDFNSTEGSPNLRLVSLIKPIGDNAAVNVKIYGLYELEVFELEVFGHTYKKSDVVNSIEDHTRRQDHGEVIMAYNLLGQEVPIDTKNEITILVYSDGYKKRVFQK